MTDLYCEHKRMRSNCEDCAAERAPQPDRIPVSGWLPEHDHDEAAAAAEAKKTTRRRAQAPTG